MIEEKIDKYLGEKAVGKYLPGILGEIDIAISKILKYYERPNPDHKIVLRDLQKIQKTLRWHGSKEV